MLYSKTTGGFYSTEIHGENIPADAVEITQEKHAALLQGQSEGKLITDDENGYPILIDQQPEQMVDTATRKRSEIDTARDAALQAGLSYTMPDGTQETVQTRPQDETNLLGLAIEARDLLAQGVDEPVQFLRVESNEMYQLTPQQMIELTDAAKNHKKLILAKSWQLKDAIDAALAAEDREAIESISWPEQPE